MVRLKKQQLYPSDIHLIINLVNSSETFKTAEGWTPMCLPHYDPKYYILSNFFKMNDLMIWTIFSTFLYVHASYLSDDCQACLLFFTTDRDSFFTLSDAKKKIVDVFLEIFTWSFSKECYKKNKTKCNGKSFYLVETPQTQPSSGTDHICIKSETVRFKPARHARCATFPLQISVCPVYLCKHFSAVQSWTWTAVLDGTLSTHSRAHAFTLSTFENRVSGNWERDSFWMGMYFFSYCVLFNYRIKNNFSKLLFI